MALFDLRPDAAVATAHPPAAATSIPVWRWAEGLRARFQAGAATAADPAGVPVWTTGNQIELMGDGLASSRALLAAVDAARNHINLEGSLASSDVASRELAEHLLARRRAGVKLHLLLDETTRHPFSTTLQQALRDSGAQLGRRRGKAGARRQLIIDGRLAFASTVDPAGQPLPARDTVLRLHGPAVATLQQLFMADWQALTGRRPLLAHYFPRLSAPGLQSLAVVQHGLGPALLAAVEQAQQRIQLTATHFEPPRGLLQALAQAAARGVQVRLLLPGVDDAPALQAGRALYGPLLRAGLQLFERRQPLQHAGAMVVDGHWTALGPGRLGQQGDALLVHDRGFAARLEATLAADLARSVQIDPAHWRHRGALQWLRERVG
jgi:cardiolipin synthase